MSRAGRNAPGHSTGRFTQSEVQLHVRPQISDETSLRPWIGNRIVIALTLVALCFFPAQIQRFPKSITTAASEWGGFDLPDHSHVEIGPNSRLDLKSFDEARRIVEHVEGEATYKVQHDPLHPFVVKTEFAIVEAVGTQFAIDHRANQRTVVTMCDGATDITRRSRPWDRSTHETVRAIKGQQVVIEPGQRMVVRSVDSDACLDLQRRHIHFYQVPVAEAIEEFNRRNVLQLAMPASAKAQLLTVSGRFKVDDPEFFAYYLEQDLRRQRDSRNNN